MSSDFSSARRTDRIGAEQVTALSMGATLMGAGGGGAVSLGELLLRRALTDRHIDVVPAAELSPDALVIHVGVVGGADVLAERLIDPEDLAAVADALVRHVGGELDAVGIIEIGGVNALAGLLAAARLGVPVVDGDLMGRAFPTIGQTTLAVAGHSATPMALVGPAGDTVVVARASPSMTEALLAAAATAMGGAAAIALYPVRAADLATVGVKGSLSECIRLGNAYAFHVDDDAERLVERLGGELLIDGRIDDLRPPAGSSPGSITVIEGDSTARIDHQNEFLAVTVDGLTRAATPDLIIALDPGNRMPLRADQLRAGQRLLVLKVPSTHRWPPHARSIVGPQAFGLFLEDVDQ